MAANVTLSSLISQIRKRANMENSKFVKDAEITEWINLSAATLYDLLVAKGEDYYATSSSLSVDGSSDSVSLPATFYKLLGVDYQLGGQSYPMQKFIFNDRHKYQSNSNVVRYRLVGSTLRFAPRPPAQTFTLWFIPALTPLADDADVLDGVNGWEDYVIVDCAIRALSKEESDTTQLERERMAIVARIEAMASNRDAGAPERVTDVTGMGYPDAYMLGDL